MRLQKAKLFHFLENYQKFQTSFYLKQEEICMMLQYIRIFIFLQFHPIAINYKPDF
jgi:hypothetical protein